jgi:hypothetical protein
MSFVPQFTAQDHEAWRAEEQKLALSSMKIGQWVATENRFTICFITCLATESQINSVGKVIK